MKKVLFSMLMFMGVGAYASSTPQPVIIQPSVTISSVSASGGQARVLVSSPTTNSPYSSGYYTYVTNIMIEAAYTGGVASSSNPVTCTSSNLPGNPTFNFAPAISTGTLSSIVLSFNNPLQGTAAATNTSITCPATANILWNVVMGYFIAS